MKQEAKTAEDELRFVMNFVAESDKPRQEFLPIFEEAIANYMVQPYLSGGGWGQQVQYPLLDANRRVYGNGGGAVLKDPESNQVVNTLTRETWRPVFGAPDFIKSRRVGLEDVGAAETVNALLAYVLALEGHNRTFFEWLKDGYIFGTAILEGYWDFYEEPRTYRGITYNQITDEEESYEQTLMAPSRDDVCLRQVDLMDFFPDPGRYRIKDMVGAAKRFHMRASEAEAMAEVGLFDKTAVAQAIKNKQTKDSKESSDKVWRTDRPLSAESAPEFLDLVGYQYWGGVPWKPANGKNRKRLITILSGERVGSKDWPLHSPRLPFFDFTVNPIQGRFYGLAPLEINRFHQDFADAILMNVADALSRSVHPGLIVERNADIDLAKLRRPRPDVPIIARTVESVSQLQYNPPTKEAMAFYGVLKEQMREAAGALGSTQGLEGPNREAATVGGLRYQAARGEIEMMCQLVEREYLPPIGKFTLSLYQQFLEDSQDLAYRIGEKPEFVPLAQILGDFDVRFVGSRMEQDPGAQLDAIERFVKTWAMTPVSAMLPWDELMREHARILNLYKVEAMVADPRRVEANLLLQQLGGPNQAAGNGNAAQPGQAPSGLMPAQTAGTVA